MGKERQYVVNERGERIAVVIGIEEYEKLLEELEDREAIREYEEAKASEETGIPLEQALAKIQRNRKDNDGRERNSGMDSERCPLHPSMYKRYCSHCQGLVRGTEENPHFTVREFDFNGNPMVEILKNGGPIHRHDEHFSFGCRKARIILACVPALKRFAWPSSSADRTDFQPETFTEKQLGLTIEVFATMNPRFVRSTGEEIEEYWLDLREMPSLKIHKGLGVMKCRAVCSVQDELRTWLARQCR